jgi:hypothetical protein
MNAEQEPQNNKPAAPPPTPVQESNKVDPAPAAPPTAQQFQEVEERMTAFERSTVRWTRVAVGISVLAAIFICAQWYEMHTGSADTHKLAEAASTQATQTTNLATAAGTQAAQTKVLADQAIIQAQANKQLAQNAVDALANTEKSFRDEQRAWVGISDLNLSTFEPNKPITIEMRIANTGRTPARNVKSRYRTHTSNLAMDGPNPVQLSNLQKTKWEYDPAIAPQGKFSYWLGEIEPGRPITAEQFSTSKDLKDSFALIKSGALIMYDYGEISYRDQSGREHTTTFCIFLANPDTKEIAFCPSFNNIN